MARSPKIKVHVSEFAVAARDLVSAMADAPSIEKLVKSKIDQRKIGRLICASAQDVLNSRAFSQKLRVCKGRKKTS